MAVFTDEIGRWFNTDALVDMKYYLADRKKVLTASFTAIKNAINDIEEGDQVLIFQDTDFINDHKNQFKHFNFGPSCLGICDAKTLMPLLVTVIKINSLDGMVRITVKLGNSKHTTYIDRKQLWRLVG